MMMMMMMMMILSIFFMSHTFDNIYYFIETFNWTAMVTRVTGHLRLDKRYFKELSFIQVALTGLCLNNG